VVGLTPTRRGYDNLEDDFPRGYKVWVFGSKIVGVLIAAIGLEMIIRYHPIWAAGLIALGAIIVLAPVRGPRAWRTEGRERIG
jgi:hypothetical protein